jgi:hypothetical protein
MMTRMFKELKRTYKNKLKNSNRICIKKKTREGTETTKRSQRGYKHLNDLKDDTKKTDK